MTKSSPMRRRPNFPVPVNSNFGNGLKLKEISEYLEVLRAPDAELVVVNKGDTKDMTGFMVCDACGKSILRSVGDGPATHNRPYQVVTKVGRPPLSNSKCDGDWKNVFFGYSFQDRPSRPSLKNRIAHV